MNICFPPPPLPAPIIDAGYATGNRTYIVQGVLKKVIQL